MTPLPPIRTALKTRRRRDGGTVPVHLHARLTEIGTLELWCAEIADDRTWRLQFDIRSATQTDRNAHQGQGETEGFVDEETWNAALATIDNAFGTDATDKPEGIVKRMTAAIDMEKQSWPPTLLRRIWESLLERESGRRKSPQHEARWLNLAGYCLRPGYGLAVDDWRVSETWRTVQGKLAHHAPTSRTESLILWRRIAGGLTAGQQRAVAEPLLTAVRAVHRRSTTGKGKAADQQLSPHEATEVWRLLGSLEWLPISHKREVGRMILDLIPKRKMQPVRGVLVWTLARIGARVPLYGPLNTVVPKDEVSNWLTSFLSLATEDPIDQFALMQLCRRTNDRARDLGDSLRDRVIAQLETNNAPEHFVQLVRDGGQLDAEEQGRAFGESLPQGLTLVSA